MGMELSTSTETKPTEPRIVGHGGVSIQFPMEWWRAGFWRQDKAIIGALIAAWTGLPFALWLAAAGFFFGAVIGFVGSAAILAHLGIFGTLVGGPAGGLPGAFLGALLGTIGGFILIYVFLITHPIDLVSSLAVGVFVSAVVFWLLNEAEQYLLIGRGYRRPSRRERELIDPILLRTGAAMELPTVPDYWISESKKPGAWMHLGAFVLTLGILGDYDETENPPTPELDEQAIAAILAHELNHWQMSDVVGLTMIQACFFPFVLITNAINWIKLRSEIAGIIGWIFLWPIWISSRFVVTPLSAYATRLAEFEADDRAKNLGDSYRLGLRKALTSLSMWEIPRSGWEDVMSATHPPIELRMQALESAVDLPPDYMAQRTGARPTRPRRKVTKPVVVADVPRQPKPRRRKPEPVPQDPVPTPEPEPLATDSEPEAEPIATKPAKAKPKRRRRQSPPPVPPSDDGRWTL
jgi:Zn-dependent protease with chaperone function